MKDVAPCFKKQGLLHSYLKFLLARTWRQALDLGGISRKPPRHIRSGVMCPIELLYWPHSDYPEADDGKGGSAQTTFGVAVVGIKGDVDGDDTVNVSDLIRVINIILGIGEEPSEVERTTADINNDGVIDVTDLIGIINIILGIG